jgi:3-deoxy-manno-octulosonate cytidylyltransferase (CMP-KDO synthetase)
MADNVVVIIPARYGSSRLPGKALAEIDGVPMVVRVYERARRIPGTSAVLVATDDVRIADAVRRAGGRVEMTRPDHPSGTDRIAEVAARLTADMVVNVQGDMPFLDPQMVVAMLRRLGDDPTLPMATLMTPAQTEAECDDPNVVKVVASRAGEALYFSRQRIPAGAVSVAARRAAADDTPAVMRHLGLYAYRRGFLATFTRLGPTPLERAERLEQLRVLEHGYRVGVAAWLGAPVVEVNTPAELEEARAVGRREAGSARGAERRQGSPEAAGGAARARAAGDA